MWPVLLFWYFSYIKDVPCGEDFTTAMGERLGLIDYPKKMLHNRLQLINVEAAAFSKLHVVSWR